VTRGQGAEPGLQWTAGAVARHLGWPADPPSDPFTDPRRSARSVDPSLAGSAGTND
jgi:hypothetical protein